MCLSVQAEAELQKVVAQWERDCGREFLVHDARYLDTINSQWKHQKVEKEVQKALRVSIVQWRCLWLLSLCVRRCMHVELQNALQHLLYVINRECMYVCLLVSNTECPVQQSIHLHAKTSMFVYKFIKYCPKPSLKAVLSVH